MIINKKYLKIKYMQTRLVESKNFYGKPFLKWAGGKTQLLDEIEKRLPKEILENKKIESYHEPFIGGGSVFLYLKSNYEIENSIISDINPELILTYKIIQKEPEKLIKYLKTMKQEYLKLDKEKQNEYYLSVRESFNENVGNINYEKTGEKQIKRASQLIFMNKTCFNGIFRLNSEGKFNVPMGKYKNPKIYDKDNIFEVHKILNDNVIIKTQDYLDSEKEMDKNSFVYLDPPYRPLTRTSSFTSYYKTSFDDNDQKILCEYIQRLTKKNVKVMLSNSDPTNADENDDFFEKLYSEQKIDKVKARRNINSNGGKRNKINELIITNY